VSGAHTVTGKPLLANDMHLPHSMPGIWYEMHLQAQDGSRPFDVAGVTLPGLPFVIGGHNRRIAWGYTNLGADVVDIYVEQFNATGQYKTPTGWLEPERRTEHIAVRGWRDDEIEVLITRHGPIVTPLLEDEDRQLAVRLAASGPHPEPGVCRHGREHRVHGDGEDPGASTRRWQCAGTRRQR
jgi:penicillin amidase